MTTEFASRMQQLKDTVLTVPGALDTELRRQAFEGGPLADPLGSYVTKVASRAHQITDQDIASLRAAGFTEEQIFEATICAAVGGGFERLHHGLSALQGTDPK